MKTVLIPLLLASAALHLGLVAHAQIAVPSSINYQGVLVDPAGNKLPDGNTNIVFRVYDAATEGTLIWGPRTNSVTIVGGSFNTLVGGLDSPPPGTPTRDFAAEVSAQALQSTAPAFLQISVGNSIIKPRQQILSTPFAFVANQARTASSSDKAGFATLALRATNAETLVNRSGVLLMSSVSGGVLLSTNLLIAGTHTIQGNGSGLTNLNVKNLSGVLDQARIPLLDAIKIPPLDPSKITGVLSTNQIPKLDGTKIVGTLEAAQIPQNLVAHNFSGNVGIGTTTPGTNRLQVVGSIRMGTGGTNFAVSGVEDLRIVRGRVSKTGAILEGTGFTSSSWSAASLRFTLTFNPPFRDSPVVTVTAAGTDGTRIPLATGASYNSPSVSGVNITTFVSSEFIQPIEFSFIAIGPR